MLDFVKMQGVGNDFVVVDRRGKPEIDGEALARRVCERRFGVGADGLLIVADPTVATSAIADVAMWMHNPDGTPDFCGNGLRCVARYLSDRSPEATRAAGLRIQTRAGIRDASVRYGAGGVEVTVGMGLPRFSPAEIPMLVFGERVVDYPLEVDGETIPLTALSTGTTHTVVLMDELPADERFFRISPLIEEHPLFPERTSVMWTARDPDPGASRLRLRIWERGAGETLGCGSGACAAALAARLRGWVGDEVLVGSRGGELLVHWRPGEEIALTGPAEYVFEGRLAVNG